MSVSAGIIGLPNVGKSTIFNALTSGKAAAENYPFCTINPNIGIIAIPDERLQRITGLLPAQKVIPAFLELVDIAGLVRGASTGEGLGNQFLGHIRNVQALVHVVRCFENNDIVHVSGSIDPKADIEIVNTELMLKDLETVENGLEHMKKAATVGDKDARQKIPLLERIRDMLQRGIPVRAGITDASEFSGIQGLQLLTAKKVLLVANVDEKGILEDNEYTAATQAIAQSQGAQYMKLCGKFEADLTELPHEERGEFLNSIGLQESGLHTLARKIYRLLDFITFFSVSPKENHAWTLKSGDTAAHAAGTIHTDFEKGFIKAEVYTLPDLQEYKTEANLRTHGKIRQEGREYRVEDGDIIYFRFNV